MSRFEQAEELTRLVKNAVKRPLTPTEEAGYNSIFMLCEEVKKLEAENADLRNELKAALERC